MRRKLDTLKISIVTPSYNQGHFIEETIKSVISQQGDFYIEYYIIDGGSSDQTLEIIKKYEQLLNEGKWQVGCLGISYNWVSEKDAGQSDALNKGFLRSTGHIVSYINSDDLYFDNAFSTVIQYFSNYPEDDFLYGDGDVINENGALQWEWLSRPYNYNVLTSYHFLWHEFTNYIMQQSVFWRRRVFDRIGLFDTTYHYAMDIEYWIRAGKYGLRFKHIPVKLGQFRLIQGTKSLSSATIFWPEQLEIFRTYNKTKRMCSFFAQYFYCEGKNNDFNTTLSYGKQENVFKRWKSLPKKEKEYLKKEAEKGFKIACLMLANECFKIGNKEKAFSIYKKLLLKHPILFFHPFSFLFLIKGLLGRKITLWLNKKYEKIVYFYWLNRYGYRCKKK